jgi:hypothetical protein
MHVVGSFSMAGYVWLTNAVSPREPTLRWAACHGAVPGRRPGDPTAFLGARGTGHVPAGPANTKRHGFIVLIELGESMPAPTTPQG